MSRCPAPPAVSVHNASPVAELMCGIAGLCSARATDPLSFQRELAAMCARIVHRGPDEEGHYIRSRVALGSRRLKVIDLSTGRMPITNETGDVAVVYNGEIYNFRSLREELIGRGHTLRSATDTEVLVHLYEEMGDDLVHRLIGMFAFAIWDDARQRLLLVRDRLGIKPLYWRLRGDTLLFGSELKCLTADGEPEPPLDEMAIAEYVSLGYIRAPRTAFEGCRKLLPGEALEFQHGRVRTWRYWRFPTELADGPADGQEAVEVLERLLRQAVRDRLVADVPLGAFLSGGLDSSVVVALAAQESAESLKTFSVGFRGNSELPAARRVAEYLGTEHHELTLDPEACGVAERLLDYFDEPFGDSSSVPTYHVSALARREVTVALSGDGGDELFAGYDQYLHDARLAWVDGVPHVVRRLLFGGASRVLPSSTRGWNRLRSLAAHRDERFVLYMTQELDPRRGGVLHPQWLRRLGRLEPPFEGAFARVAHLPFAARLLYVDATTYLPDDILTKVDRMSMAHSLEARVPLLDHRLVEFVAALPVEWKLRNGVRKWLLRRIAEPLLPHDVLARPKRGFTLPVAHWLLTELRAWLDGLLLPTARSAPCLHAPTVARMIDEHRRGRRDHSHVLWRLVMLERWLAKREQELPDASMEARRYA